MCTTQLTSISKPLAIGEIQVCCKIVYHDLRPTTFSDCNAIFESTSTSYSPTVLGVKEEVAAKHFKEAIVPDKPVSITEGHGSA